MEVVSQVYAPLYLALIVIVYIFASRALVAIAKTTLAVVIELVVLVVDKLIRSEMELDGA